ncbi:hypothetical protein ACFL2E_03485 [Thermodesulfobacteriota bacterium]
MLDIKNYSPAPHPAKAIFKSHNIPISTISKALELSFSYTSTILNGHARVTPEVEKKLNMLVESIADGGSR